VPCFVGVPAVAAIVSGHLALRELKENPKLAGRGRAVTGISLGYAGSAIWLGAIVMAVYSVVQGAQ